MVLPLAAVQRSDGSYRYRTEVCHCTKEWTRITMGVVCILEAIMFVIIVIGEV